MKRARFRSPAPAAVRASPRREECPPLHPLRQFWRLRHRLERSSVPCTAPAHRRSSRVERARPRMPRRETVASFMTPFGCDRVRQPLLPYGLNGMRFQRSAYGIELPDTVEHVGRVNVSRQELHAPDVDRPGNNRSIGELAAHLAQIAATVGALFGCTTTREVAGNIECAHT